MACCLMATCHFLNQYWLIIGESILPKSIATGIAQESEFIKWVTRFHPHVPGQLVNNDWCSKSKIGTVCQQWLHASRSAAVQPIAHVFFQGFNVSWHHLVIMTYVLNCWAYLSLQMTAWRACYPFFYWHKSISEFNNDSIWEDYVKANPREC